MAQAEKFKIFEAEIDVNKATENVRALKATLQNLKEEAKKVKEGQGEMSDEYIEYQAAIKSVSGELRQAEKITKTVIDAQNANEGSLKQLKSQLALVTAEWNDLSEEQRLNTDRGKQLTAVKKQLTEQLTAEEKATGDARRQVGFYERAMQGNVEAVGQFVPAAGRAAGAAKTLGTAFKVMLGPVGILIGLIAAIVKSFQAFFTSTEEGQNTLRRFQMIFKTVFDSVNRILVGFAETMIKAFNDPKQAIADLWEAIKQNFVNRFTGLVAQLKAFGTILQGVWDLDWDKIKQGGKDYANATIQVLTGVENALDKIKKGWENLSEEQQARIAEAERIARLQDELDKRQRKTLVENAKLQTQIDKLREDTAKKEEFSAQRRLELLDEAIEKEKQIEQNNIEIAKRKLEIQQAQNALTLSTKEDLEAEARLQAELIQVEGNAARKRRELESQRVEALRQIQAEAKAAADAEFNALLAQFDAIEQEIEKEIQLRKEAEDRKAQLAEEARLKDLQRLQTDLNNRLAIVENDIFKRLDVEREFLAQQRDLELQAAEAIGADKELIRDKYRQIDKQLEYEKEMAKWNIASQFASQLASLFGEQTRLGKAAAVAATAINTYKGAMAAFAETPGGIVIKSAAAALATATGIKAISDILKVKTNISAGNSGGSMPSMSSTTASLPSPTAVTPQLGSSIATQPANNAISRQSDISQNTVLVVDDVTAKQVNAKRNRKVGSI